MENVPDKLKKDFGLAYDALISAQKVCIISHSNPDGDAVGSNLALRLCLEEMGKEVVSACVDPIPLNSMHLKNADKFVQDFDYEDFDVIVSVDCGALKLVGFHETKPEILSGKKPFINFDHHGSNNNFGTINCVDPSACAAGFIIYHFLKFARCSIKIDAATCLLHGIYFDTGGMMHSNATLEVFKVASELMAKGANVQKISKELFHTTPVNKLHLWGRILERTYVNEDNVTVSAVGFNDYEATETTPKDTGGVIDYLNSVPESRYCVLLSEDNNSRVKGSLRTQRDDVNLSDVASKWGGGGHAKASGFGVEGKLRPVMSWKVVPDEGGETSQSGGVDIKF